MEHFIYLDNALLNGEDLHTVTATFDVAAGIAFIDLGDGRSLQLDRAQLHDLLAELPAPPDDQEPPYLNEPWKY